MEVIEHKAPQTFVPRTLPSYFRISAAMVGRVPVWQSFCCPRESIFELRTIYIEHVQRSLQSWGIAFCFQLLEKLQPVSIVQCKEEWWD